MKMVAKHINEAFKLISSLKVSGDAVDVVAVARNYLRQAYALVENEAKKEGEKPDDNGASNQ